MMFRPLATLCLTAGLIGFASSAAAQNNDALWDRYNTAATEFGGLYTQTDELDPIATRGNRIYRETIGVGQELVAVLDQLLELDSGITAEERVAAMDSLLTTRQIIGSLMVEVQQCDEGLTELEQLLEHPELVERPLVLESATLWKGRAETCIAQQQRAAERERRAAQLEAEEQRLADEAAAREAEIRELEARMANEQDEAVLAEMQRRMNELSAQQAVSLDPEPVQPAVGSYVLMGAGVLALGTGIVWDLTLRDERSDFNDIVYGDDGMDESRRSEAEEHKDAIDRGKAPIAVLYGAGAGMIVGGIIWNRLSRHRDRGDSTSAVELTPFFADDGGGLIYTRSF